jgi:hypothetical protein
MEAIDNELMMMNAEGKRRLMAYVGSLPVGPYEVTVKAHKQRRSGQAHRFYFGFVVAPFARYMMSHNDELTMKAAMDAAHLRLKQEFLDEIAVTDENGEVITSVLPSETKLSKDEMRVFIDKCIAWLATKWDIVVVDPREYFGTEKVSAK